MCYHGDVGLEDLLDELVPGGVNQLDDVAVQSVSVLFQKTCEIAKRRQVQLLIVASRINSKGRVGD